VTVLLATVVSITDRSARLFFVSQDKKNDAVVAALRSTLAEFDEYQRNLEKCAVSLKSSPRYDSSFGPCNCIYTEVTVHHTFSLCLFPSQEQRNDDAAK